MIHKSRALIFGHRKLKLNPIDNACSNGSQFKYYISILGGRGVQNLVKHAYIIHEWSLKTISLKFSLEHFKQFASLPHLVFYPWFFISDYYRSLSIAIALKYYYQYHYHYRSKSHYRTSLKFLPLNFMQFSLHIPIPYSSGLNFPIFPVKKILGKKIDFTNVVSK